MLLTGCRFLSIEVQWRAALNEVLSSWELRMSSHLAPAPILDRSVSLRIGFCSRSYSPSPPGLRELPA